MVEATDRLGAYLRQEKTSRYSVKAGLTPFRCRFFAKLTGLEAVKEASCDFTVYVLRALGISCYNGYFHYGPGKGSRSCLECIEGYNRWLCSFSGLFRLKSGRGRK